MRASRRASGRRPEVAAEGVDVLDAAVLGVEEGWLGAAEDLLPAEAVGGDEDDVAGRRPVVVPGSVGTGRGDGEEHDEESSGGEAAHVDRPRDRG